MGWSAALSASSAQTFSGRWLKANCFLQDVGAPCSSRPSESQEAPTRPSCSGTEIPRACSTPHPHHPHSGSGLPHLTHGPHSRWEPGFAVPHLLFLLGDRGSALLPPGPRKPKEPEFRKEKDGSASETRYRVKVNNATKKAWGLLHAPLGDRALEGASTGSPKPSSEERCKRSPVVRGKQHWGGREQRERAGRSALR